MDGPYFAPLNPKCEVGRSFVESNRLTWHAFNAILPQPDEDAELAFADVSRKLGLTSYKAEHLFYGFKKISYLPKLRHLNKLDWFLDYDRILAIGKALQGVEERIYPFVDDALEELFTPRRPNQRLPEASRIRKVISEVLALHYCVEGEVEEDRDRYHMERYAGRGEITANLDAVTAETIDRLVRKRAEKEGISFARALAATILDPIEQKIVINVFQQADTSLAFAPGYGYIDPPEGASTREIAPGETEGTARLKQFERLLRRAMERAEVQVVTCLLTLRSSTTEFPTRMAEKPRAIIWFAFANAATTSRRMAGRSMSWTPTPE